jgi:hypothetical protein
MCRGGADRVSSKSGDVSQHRVGSQGLHLFVAGDEGGDGEASAESFADGKDVGHDAKSLERKKGAGPTKSTLNLVEDQERPGFVAALAHLPEIVRVGNTNSGVTLNRFHDHAGGPIGNVDQVFGVVEVDKTSIKRTSGSKGRNADFFTSFPETLSEPCVLP